MLIWYANIPEETTYYLMRVEHYKLLYFGMFVINFAFPMLILMSRDAKRHAGILTFVGLVILAGHWLDVWIMVMGGSMGPTASRSEEHTSELQSRPHLVCRRLLE